MMGLRADLWEWYSNYSSQRPKPGRRQAVGCGFGLCCPNLVLLGRHGRNHYLGKARNLGGLTVEHLG